MKYKLLLVMVTVVWGSSFVIMKDLVDDVNPAWLLAVRFALAAVALALLSLKYRKLFFQREYVKYGIIIGLPLFVGYLLQTIGLTDTTPGKNAFLTASYCVMIPFLNWAALRRKPNRFHVVAAFMCLFGIGLISLNEGFSVSFGDAATLSCAFFYALQLIFMVKFGRGRNPAVLTIWQLAVISVGSALVALATGASFDFSMLGGEAWLALAYLAVVVTALAILFQNVGIANVEPATAGLLLSLESVFGVAFSIALGYEALTPRVLVGFLVVFAAIVMSEYVPQILNRKRMSR
ncbi:DMT family transporter [Denitrobacterium detoxificans]|jgi:drug/metabolite transporter (DMT)-like permease|uniref:DMT family transporter n=1 Tax=Denitrobacterium detoxificans TaxID=79604 RepID=UPI0026EEB462|nr:DMT family transporter [Denitrobacterium detoxificans]MBE6466656.1 DMT family transporter [Denitrobacterium detoxificans]